MILVPVTIKLFGEYNFYCPGFLLRIVNFVGIYYHEIIVYTSTIYSLTPFKYFLSIHRYLVY